MGRVLHTMLADTPLVKNLDSHEYMEILLDGKERLEELFAELESTRCAEELKLNLDAGRILQGFRQLIMKETLPEKTSQLVTCDRAAAQSN